MNVSQNLQLFLRDLRSWRERRRIRRDARRAVRDAIRGERALARSNALYYAGKVSRDHVEAAYFELRRLRDLAETKLARLPLSVMSTTPPEQKTGGTALPRPRLPVINTRTVAQNMPLIGLLGAMSHAVTQEAAGQAQLVCQTTDIVPGQRTPVQLPADIDNGCLEELSAAGVEFGPGSEGDPVFRDCLIPDGWRILPTGHDMWTNLVDGDGMVRASIFYKASAHDRKAQIHAKHKLEPHSAP